MYRGTTHKYTLKKEIETMLAGITDVDIATYQPKPAPEMEGHGTVCVLTTLTDRLIRLYVACQIIKERHGMEVLGIIRSIAQSVPGISALYHLVFNETLPQGMTWKRFRELVTETREGVDQALERIGDIEPNELDGAVYKLFRTELATAIAGNGLTASQLEELEYDIYVHEGQWVVAATKCTCLSCLVEAELRKQTTKAAEVPQHIIDDLLAKHPSSIRLTDADTVDLSTFPEDEHDVHREHLRSALESGDIVLDLGAGKQPRFLIAEVRTGSTVFDTENFDLDILAALLSRVGSPKRSKSKRRQSSACATGVAGWAIRPQAGQ